VPPGWRPTPSSSPNGAPSCKSWAGGIERTPGRSSLDPPADLVAAFGPMPTERRAQATWRAAVSQVDSYRRAWGIERPGSAKHEERSEREEEHKEHAGTAPVEDRQASPTSRRSRPERRPARCERRAVRAEELLGPQPTEDLRQRRAWQAARTTIERYRERTRSRDGREREAG
jgi:hypothetical protein